MKHKFAVLVSVYSNSQIFPNINTEKKILYNKNEFFKMWKYF